MHSLIFTQFAFTPCAPGASLLEAFAEAAKKAVSGGAVWLSPACSSFDQIRRDQHRGEILCSSEKSIDRGFFVEDPNMHGAVTAKVIAKGNMMHTDRVWRNGAGSPLNRQAGSLPYSRRLRLACELNSNRERMFKRFASRFFEEKTRGKNPLIHRAPRNQMPHAH